MATLWKRATPSQYRMLRVIAGAVHNAAHAHQIEVPDSFARGVAKRATGALTAQWAEVLAATANRRQEGLRDSTALRDPRGSHPTKGSSEGDRLRLLRRSPIRFIWKRYAANMWKIKRFGTSEQYEAHIRVLKLLAEAQRELDDLDRSHNG